MEGAYEDRPLDVSHFHCIVSAEEPGEGAFWPALRGRNDQTGFRRDLRVLDITELTADEPKKKPTSQPTYDRFVLAILAMSSDPKASVRLADPPLDDDQRRNDPVKDPGPAEDAQKDPEGDHGSRLPATSPDGPSSGEGANGPNIETGSFFLAKL